MAKVTIYNYQLYASNYARPYRPIPVWGYNDAYPVAGDIFEAETGCNTEHNMGQIASSGVSDFSYFSRKKPITTPKAQNPIPSMTFNASKTYMLFVLGK